MKDEVGQVRVGTTRGLAGARPRACGPVAGWKVECEVMRSGCELRRGKEPVEVAVELFEVLV